MKDNIIKRVLDEAFHIITTGETIRDIAKVYNVSKSTVHKDFSERLKEIDKSLYQQVAKILQHHIKIRHIRGGESTRKKYLNLKSTI
ncbi:MAG: sporulation transcriptional regulator SpoIIID [Bacilli bacterium]|jgi:putative DeoR family transcriptional regulator (stage III sporulation protein D)|nr:sporulation transcriptional regulator SpoIIID [Bacilli bacterium]